MQFSEIVRKRYAAKRFDGRKIPEEQVRELLEYVRLAPSSLNLQPWKIKVITDAETKERLKPVSWHQAQITTCSHLLVFCANTDMLPLITKVDRAMFKAGVPDKIREDVIAISRDRDARLSPHEKLVWSQYQVYLAAGNALNGAKALGFDACPIGGFDPLEYSRILELPATLVPTLVCPLGYGADTPLPKARLEMEDILI